MEHIKKFGLTGFQIKIIGIVLMFCDHIFEMFGYAGAPLFLRWLGRPVAILFIYMSVEGFIHTRNRKKYAFRLLIGFWAMSILNLIIGRSFPLPDVALMNNVFGTLFLGVFALICIETIRAGVIEKKLKKILLGVMFLIIPALIYPIIMMGVTNGARWVINLMFVFPGYQMCEGGIAYVILPVVLFYVRRKKYLQMPAIALIALLSTGFNFSGDMLNSNFYWMCAFSIIPLCLYNGEKGRGLKNFFYIFYPAHIYALYFASYIYFHYFIGIGGN